MNEIWIAEQGEYSDYSVMAAFSTEEAAQEWVRLYNVRNGYDKGGAYSGGYMKASVSILALDPSPYGDEETKEHGFQVYFNRREAYFVGVDRARPEHIVEAFELQHGFATEKGWFVWVSYEDAKDDPERAKKIARDRLTHFLADAMMVMA